MSGYVIKRLQPHAEKIIRRYQSGESFDAIAADHDCGWSTIRRFLLSHAVPLPSPQRP